jgi:hypothetical protein
MQHSESGVSEIISAVLAVLLVIALAAVVGAIFLGWAVPLQKTAYIATQCSPVNITNASAVQLFLSQGETVSLAPATAYGLPVRFSLTNGSATYNFVPLPGTASQGWKPGTSLILFRNASGFWVTDSISSVKNNTGFSNGTWAVNIIDANSKVLIAQHTVTLTGSGAPAPSPVYPGFTVEAWVRWNQNPAPAADDQRWATIVVDGNTDNNRRYQLQHDQTNAHFEFAFGTSTMTGSGTWVTSAKQPLSGTWYYVTGVYNQTPATKAIYVNGVWDNGGGGGVTVNSAGLRASPGKFQVGGPAGIQWPGPTNMQRKFNGDIRGLKTYDRAMVPDEVASRFAAGLPVS